MTEAEAQRLADLFDALAKVFLYWSRGDFAKVLPEGSPETWHPEAQP